MMVGLIAIFCLLTCNIARAEELRENKSSIVSTVRTVHLRLHVGEKRVYDRIIKFIKTVFFPARESQIFTATRIRHDGDIYNLPGAGSFDNAKILTAPRTTKRKNRTNL